MKSRHTRVAGGTAILTSLALLGAAAPATAVSAASETQATAVGGTVTEADTPEAAIVAAHAVNRRVEVLERRTESSTTWANPDGTLVTELSSGPVRMLRNGSWVDVDATLTRRADGSVAAKAHPQELRLAGGGGERASSVTAAATAPDSANRDLVTLGMGSRRMAVQWKGGLPAPTVHGHHAVYRQAVPGADLLVDATRDGFEQFLVLKDRPAQDKAPWTVPLRLPGIDATQQEDGSVSLKDRKSGEEVGVMPAPVMWDAQVDPRSGEHTHSARVPMTLSQDGDTVELTLTPDPDFLSDLDTEYPVTIDPATDALGTLFDTFVQEGDTTDQSASTDLKLGWPGDYADTAKTRKRIARSYLTWDTSVFADALVSSAKLSLYNYHSWSCETRPWEVWAANGADTDTRWSNQPARLQKIATSTETRSGSCKNAGWVSADVTSLARTWASAKAETGSIALKAADESDTYAWKRFYSSESTAEQIPQLTVSYNYRPRAGSNLQAGPPFYSQGGIYRVNSTTPTLRFTPEDSDNDDSVRGTYQITDVATGKVVTSVVADPVPTGETSKVVVPAGKLTDGRTYSFRTTTDDGTHWANGWSEPVTFTVDTGMRMTPELKALSAVNSALDAADVTPATTSDGTYAAIAANGTNTVGVPWVTGDHISVQSTDRGTVGVGLPVSQPRGVALNGNVVYANPDGPVDTVAQPTLEGGARTFQVIKNATAPHEYTSAMRLPAGARLTPFDGDTVLISSGTDDAPVVHGLIDAPWARDANGAEVPTSFRIEGDKLVQTVDFTATTAFPVVADPKVSVGWGIYLNATGAEWKAYSQVAVSAGWGAWLYGCTAAKMPAKIAGIGKMVCGAVGVNAWTNLAKWLKQIYHWKLSAVGCYQVKIWPFNKKLTKVSRKNCR
ncbi:DNRLRE domain-containing protein [Streptomyces sp. S.PB5]|uniref:DNRLRE domain-containing protein n=1 Tax=Streptomyces sp. S.PB5 TaxID=3020844 RepID=UPI0025AFE0F8|nr:DNRLRE domain-containing protein [Streptomyces sp. S.PB5]MDN3026666.1 DNRLRE domain-containing protein [Streptomyces sp. S.PB5]